MKAKKIFGQHFLHDQEAVRRILEAVKLGDEADHVVEVGPGPGVLTGALLERFGEKYRAVEIDRDMVEHLMENFPNIKDKLISANFLKLNWQEHFPGKVVIVGNFPYNISSQIVFAALDHREQVIEMVGMFQKEMADRIVSKPGSKDYGIISVLSQLYFDMEYLFKLGPEAFRPPPKVNSAVIRLQRNKVENPACDERLLKQVVKLAFNQRRKMLRNSLKSMLPDNAEAENPVFTKRPEQLSLADFIELTQLLNPK